MSSEFGRFESHGKNIEQSVDLDSSVVSLLRISLQTAYVGPPSHKEVILQSFRNTPTGISPYVWTHSPRHLQAPLRQPHPHPGRANPSQWRPARPGASSITRPGLDNLRHLNIRLATAVHSLAVSGWAVRNISGQGQGGEESASGLQGKRTRTRVRAAGEKDKDTLRDCLEKGQKHASGLQGKKTRTHFGTAGEKDKKVRSKVSQRT